MHDNVSSVSRLDGDEGLKMLQEVDLIFGTLARICVNCHYDRFVCSKCPGKCQRLAAVMRLYPEYIKNKNDKIFHWYHKRMHIYMKIMPGSEAYI